MGVLLLFVYGPPDMTVAPEASTKDQVVSLP